MWLSGRIYAIFVSTFHFMMSTEEGEAGSACEEARGGTAVTHRHTWDEGEPHGCQGRPRPAEEDEAAQGEEAEDAEDAAEGEEAEGCREGRSCGDACGGDNAGNISSEDGAVGGTSSKAQTMHSNCSSETCIPTPSCRICFQGAEQVTAPPTRSQLSHHCTVSEPTVSVASSGLKSWFRA